MVSISEIKSRLTLCKRINRSRGFSPSIIRIYLHTWRHALLPYFVQREWSYYTVVDLRCTFSYYVSINLPALPPGCRNLGGIAWLVGYKIDLVGEFVKESVESTIILSLNLISVVRLAASRILLPQASSSFFEISTSYRIRRQLPATTSSRPKYRSKQNESKRPRLCRRMSSFNDVAVYYRAIIRQTNGATGLIIPRD